MRDDSSFDHSRSPTRRGGVQSLSELTLARRRQDRRRAGATKTLTTMKRGASLHLHYSAGRSLWRLSNGEFIPDEVARMIIARPEIIGCDDGLPFPNAQSHQTWRFSND